MIHELVNPDGVSQADLAVFIPSCREAGHIALPVRKAAIGLRKFFPEFSSVIVNCDNNSQDGTREIFFSTESNVPRIYASTPPGSYGKGANLRNAYEIAARLGAKVVVVLDANLLSIKSTWIKSLVQPVLEGAEYTAPLYLRHKYDAPISRGFAYPLLRSLFGRRVLQPICVDHAFSGRLNDIFLNQTWDDNDRGFRADLQMLTQAIINKAPVCQSFMAHPRISEPGDLDKDLPRSFSLVVEAVFDLMLKTEDFWTGIKRSRPAALAGADSTPVNPPPVVEVESQTAIDNFIRLGRQHRSLWAQYLPADILVNMEAQLNLAADGGLPSLAGEMWRKIVFAAALAYKKASPLLRPDICASLSPPFLINRLYIQQEAEKMSEQQFHAFLENEAAAFEAVKPGLVERWISIPDEG